MKIDLTTPEKNLAEASADAIDEMLRIDGQAVVLWRQMARALRAGDAGRAFELLDQVRQSSSDAAIFAAMAAKGVFALFCSHSLERTAPDKAAGEDLEQLINMMTPPHAKDPANGGN